MPEIHTNVRTYQVDYACDTCNNGHLVAGKILLSDPPRWEHTCTNPDCDAVQNFYVKYPSIQYEQLPTAEEEAADEATPPDSDSD